MLNLKTISKILGALLGIEALLMSLCLTVSLLYQGNDVTAFIWAILITIAAGTCFRLMGRHADNTIGRRDAYFVVAVAWVIFSLFGTLPFLISGNIPDFTNAFFETMSGFTTTGATIVDYPERFPKGLLFWRSLTQWIGGLGIVFFTIAILPSLVGGSLKVFAAESTGPIKSKLHPRLSTGAKWIWMVYLVLTTACVVSYKLCGMTWFDSFNYAMTSTATGGFATESGSIATFHSPAGEYVCTIFCFLSGVNFTLLYTSVAGFRFRQLFRNSEFKFYTMMIAAFTLFIMLELIFQRNYEVEHAFRSSVFQVVSFITTTGLFNDDAAQWPHVTWVVLATCMFLGACSGSTSGGFKSIRSVMMLKIIRNEFKQILHPNAILPIHVDGSNIPSQKRVTLLSFLAVYLLLCLFASFIFIAAGVDNTNAITITLSTLGNVGPSLGLEIGPTMSWSMLPAGIKWVCSALMLIGRIEIFTILVIFTPAFWKDR